ncbi:MAG: 3-hydroxybutyryl-CoA dehydrogenase [Myxococcales bacterium]
MAIETLIVVGAGQMGSGIAQVAAQSGLQVTLLDVKQELLDKARDRIKGSLEKLAKKGTLSAADADAAAGRIRYATEAAPGSADFAVEAVTENENLKREIFKMLDKAVKPGGVIASNTSSISITRLATAVSRPDAVVGMHFMNPVPLMALVEVIRGLQTSEETYAQTLELAKRMGKTTVTARDMPGFIVNRILIPMINEACYALMEGLGTAEDIDTAMKLGTNQPMGPLTLADFIGLDTCLYIAEVLYDGLGDSKYRPCPLLRQYVDAGWLGRKSGRGFYKY